MSSKTINPLHFEDLEPHRFEDLVRQLIYDFRQWQTIEATGRSGSDEGFDVRATEITSEPDDSDGDDEGSEERNVRIWLVQCKRERAIGPSKMAAYADEIIKKEGLYGVIFASCCDFSKQTRDTFREKLRGSKIQEIHIWGKAELEDNLYQPKNDHLLFAYFNFSLLTRQRSIKTKLRSNLAIKKKLVNHFGMQENHFQPILIRDIKAQEYPYIKSKKEFQLKPRWGLFHLRKFYYAGILLEWRKFYAYLEDEIKWDYAPKYNQAFVNHDPWREKKEKLPEENELYDFWFKIPEDKRAWLYVLKPISFEQMIAFDDMGDEYTNEYGQTIPHLHVTYGKNGPFEDFFYASIETIGRFNKIIYSPDLKDRIKYFHSSVRAPKKTE